MSDRLVIRLNEKWAVLADNQQWILARTEKQARDAAKRHPTERFRGIAYIGGHKATLLRSARENGVSIDPKALATIEAWPDRFLTWRDLAQARAA